MTLQALLLRALPSVAPGGAFAESERRTLAAAATVLLEGSPVAVAPAEVVDAVERFLIAGRSKRAWRIRALLTLVEWAPVTLRRKRFSKMSHDERRRLVTERYITGKGVWAVCAKVRFIVYLGAYGSAKAHGPTGYVPMAARPRLRERLAAGARA